MVKLGYVYSIIYTRTYSVFKFSVFNFYYATTLYYALLRVYCEHRTQQQVPEKRGENGIPGTTLNMVKYVTYTWSFVSECVDRTTF